MHSYTSSLFHCIFASKAREPLLTGDIRARLWPYLGGIAREQGMKALAIGGVVARRRVAESVEQVVVGRDRVGAAGVSSGCDDPPD